MLAGILSLAFSISILCLLCVHTYMIMFNMSTIEMGALVNRNPFNKGNIWENIEQTMGKDWRLWLFPIDPVQRVYNGLTIFVASGIWYSWGCKG